MKREQAPTARLVGDAPRRSVYIYIYHKTPSCNEWSNKKHHQWIYAKIKREWRQRLNIALRLLRGMKLQKFSIEAERFTSTRFLDQGNAVDGLKPIIDCLVERNGGLGIIKDDNPACMPEAPKVKQTKCNDERYEKTVFRIKEIES